VLVPAEAVAAAESLDVGTLQALLKKKRAAQAAEATVVPPLPAYEPADALAGLHFEYGLELAFRPESDPLRVQAERLVPLLYGPPLKSTGSPSWDRKCSLQRMFEASLPKFVEHLKAKTGDRHMSSCGKNEIEFPSPVMTHMSQIEWYYARIKALADGIGAKPDNDKSTSGGGHVHVSPLGTANWTDSDFVAALLEVCDKPWLSWIFNDPDDHGTAMSPVSSIVRAAWKMDEDTDGWLDVADFAKCAVRRNENNKKPTLEFRFFAAPRDWDEQRAHIVFLDRWLSSFLPHKGRKYDKKEIPDLPHFLPRHLMQVSFEAARKGFVKLLKELKLPLSDYQRFIDRNLKVRYDKGWIRN
jgi:hypothetical protein